MTDTVTKYTHKGIEITFDAERAFFAATGPDGKRVTAPSLDAIKKKLDVKKAFAPFTGLIEVTIVEKISEGAIDLRYKNVGKNDPRIVCAEKVVPWGHWNDEVKDDNLETKALVRVNVVGLVTDTSRSRYFVIEGSNSNVDRLLADSQETIDGWKQHIAFENKSRRLEREKRKADSDATAALKGFWKAAQSHE